MPLYTVFVYVGVGLYWYLLIYCTDRRIKDILWILLGKKSRTFANECSFYFNLFFMYVFILWVDSTHGYFDVDWGKKKEIWQKKHV